MDSWLYFVLMVVGLIGFVVSMCVVVYLFYKRPAKEEALPDGQYHIHFMGHNKQTGAPIYDVEQLKLDDPKESGAPCHPGAPT